MFKGVGYGYVEVRRVLPATMSNNTAATPDTAPPAAMESLRTESTASWHDPRIKLSRFHGPLLTIFHALLPRPTGRSLLLMSALAAGYFITAQPCLLLGTVNGSVSPVWAPAGVAMAFLLLGGLHLWPGLLIGAALGNLVVGLPWGPAWLTASGSSLGTLLMAALYRKWFDPDQMLHRVRDALGLTITAAVGCAVSAGIGMTALLLTFPDIKNELVFALWTWWAGDWVGVMLVTPAVFIIARWQNQPLPNDGQTTRRLIVMSLVGGALGAVLLAYPGPVIDFLIFPFMAWVAVRLGPRWMVLTALFIATGAIVSTAYDIGPFADQPLNQQLLNLQVFLGVVALTSMLLSVVVVERQREAQALRESEARLRTILMQTNAGVVAATPDGTMFLCNHRACEILNVREDQMIGQRATDVSWGLVDGESRALAVEEYPVSHVVRLGTSLRDQIIGVKVAGRHDKVWLSVNADPVIDRHGKLHYVILTFDDITQKRQAEDTLRHMALSDRLTDLPNREAFRQQVEAALQRHQADPAFHFAVMFLDSDRFKLINDSLGHLVGDQLLIALSRRLVDGLNHDAGQGRFIKGLAARHGGDEFLVLLEGVRDAEAAVWVAKRLQEVLAQPYFILGHEVYTAVSIGITTSHSAYRRADEVIRDADTAMYRAKHNSAVQGCVLFDQNMHQQARHRLSIENDLRRAIERQQLYLEYQPLINLRTGRPAGFEALLRWQHPQRGRISPDMFIPIAEETGLIRPIGAWVLREAAQQMVHWREQTQITEPLQINVNVSRKQLDPQAQLPQTLRQVLDQTGLDPRVLHLEITESSLMDNTHGLLGTLEELRRMQVKLELDDFGTGFSSLSCLHRFPLNGLKIDRSFVQHMDERSEYASTMRAIITLAHDLGIRATVEGIENARQYERVRELRADRVQGYHLARPMPATRAGEWMLQQINQVAA